MEKPQLFLLHFAGGNCYSFQFLMPLLTGFEIIPLELPGRGKRIKEDLLKDFDLAAQDMFEQIKSKVTTPFFMYGHSMGAYLTLRVANMLEKTGKRPAYLFVSGNPGPGVKENKKRYLLEQDAFIEELKSLGGVPEEFITNKELFEFYEPILRADFEVAEKNDLKDEVASSAPLYAMMGDREEKVEEIANWGRFSNAQFNYEIMEGDHFFIHQHANAIAKIINHACNNTRLLQNT
jgi:external thioesterase TEII